MSRDPYDPAMFGVGGGLIFFSPLEAAPGEIAVRVQGGAAHSIRILTDHLQGKANQIETSKEAHWSQNCRREAAAGAVNTGCFVSLCASIPTPYRPSI